jgi:hypothetical protein
MLEMTTGHRPKGDLRMNLKNTVVMPCDNPRLMDLGAKGATFEALPVG